MLIEVHDDLERRVGLREIRGAERLDDHQRGDMMWLTTSAREHDGDYDDRQ